MRVIVAGSRSFTFEDYGIVADTCLATGLWFSTILSGKATGVDRLGEKFAEAMGIPVDPYPADWRRYGLEAGRIRNELMATKADALILIWDGHSSGSRHMLEAARHHKLLVHIRTAVPTPLMPRRPIKGA